MFSNIFLSLQLLIFFNSQFNVIEGKGDKNYSHSDFLLVSNASSTTAKNQQISQTKPRENLVTKMALKDNGTHSADFRYKREVFTPNSLLATEQYYQATSSPFFLRGLANWDERGNRIINANYSASNVHLLLYIKDPKFDQVLLSDLFSLENTFKKTLGWRKLTLCYSLAVLRREKAKKKEVTFTSEDCASDTIFQIDLFPGSGGTKLDRMNHCYKDETALKEYSKCLLRGLAKKFDPSWLKKPCQFTGQDAEFLNSRFGSHLREICFANSLDIYEHFEEELKQFSAPHVVNTFGMEMCSLGTFFKPGKMSICFPNFGPKARDIPYTAECQLGHHRLTIEYVSPTRLLIVFGNIRYATNSQYFFDLPIPAREIACKRLIFNKYKSAGIGRYFEKESEFIGQPILKSGLPADLIPVPMELMTVYGDFLTVSDQIDISIHNSFANTFFFLRFGALPNAIKCFWSYIPTEFVCNNVEGKVQRECSAQYQSSTSTSQENELTEEKSEEMKASLGAEIELTRQMKISGSMDKSTKSAIVQKYLESFLQGRQFTVNQPLSAAPGEITALWQEAFTCLGHRYMLPAFAQKNHGRGGEIYHFPEFHFGETTNWREIDEDNLSLKTFEGPRHVLFKGPCEMPLRSNSYNESECHYIEVPRDLAKIFYEAIQKIQEKI